MQQKLGTEIRYKAGGDMYMNFDNVQEVLTYFNHLQETAEAQSAGEELGEDISVEILNVRMDAVSSRKFIDDIARIGLDHEVTKQTVEIKLDEGVTRKKHITFLTLPSYTVKIIA